MTVFSNSNHDIHRKKYMFFKNILQDLNNYLYVTNLTFKINWGNVNFAYVISVLSI